MPRQMSLIGHQVIRTGNRYAPVTDAEIAQVLVHERERYKTERFNITQLWREEWALYIGSPAAMEYARQNVLKTTGNVDNTYMRSRINTGKAYESIETIHAYLMGAVFPNDDWCACIPTHPGYAELARVIQKFMSMKFEESNFRDYFSSWLRQWLIVGVSTMALPWRYETIPYKKRIKYEKPVQDDSWEYSWQTVTEERVVRDSPEFIVIDSFDTYFDPVCSDINESPMFRRIVKTKADIVHCIETGYYQNISPDDLDNASTEFYGYDDNTWPRLFQQVESSNQSSKKDRIEVWEFWGDIHLEGLTLRDVWATVIGDKLVRFEPNPYWDGRPFVSSVFLPIPGTPYGMSALQPNMGLLHELNITTNARADNLMISVDSMFEVVEDGLLENEVIRSEPGRVFRVREKGTINPIDTGPNKFMVTYQEEQALKQAIDANFGVGAGLNAAPMRSGERVTATEITAMTEAGGSRLANIHTHLEQSFLMRLLNKCYRYTQQFVTSKNIVRVKDTHDLDKYIYYWVGPEQLQYDFKFKPMGSLYVVAKQRYLNNMSNLLGLVAAYPVIAEKINWDKLLYDLVYQLGFDDPESYIKPVQQPAPSPEATPTPEQMSPLYEMGGRPLEQAVMNTINTDPTQLLAALTNKPDLPPDIAKQSATTLANDIIQGGLS